MHTYLRSPALLLLLATLAGCAAEAAPAVVAVPPARTESAPAAPASSPPAAPAPPPRASSAPQGGVPVSSAAAVVATMQAGFRRCYKSALQADPNAAGEVQAKAKIDATGAVTSTSETHTGLSEATVRCIVDVVAKGVFPPPEGGSATIVIPAMFKSL